MDKWINRYIIHGENRVESRKKLSEIIRDAKSKDWEVTRVDGTSLTRGELLTHSRSQTLLSTGQLLVIENYFRNKQSLSSNNKKAAEEVLEIPQDDAITLVFWEGKALTPATVRKLQTKFAVQEFKIPVAVFKFLDSLAPNNAKHSLRLLLEAKNRDEAEFLLIMMARQVRLLIWAKEDKETLKLPPWMKNNLIRQSEKFTLAQLIALHGRILELDRDNKHSQLPENLDASLELLVAGL